MRSAALAALAALAGPLAAAGEPAEGSTYVFPRAGISLFIPGGGDPAPLLGYEYEVLHVGLKKADGAGCTVRLWAYPVADKVTADGYADAQLGGMKRDPAVWDYKLLKKTHMPVGGLKAAGRLISYTYRQAKCVEARMYFVRPLAGAKVNVCYVLGFESPGERQSLRVLGEVIKTVTLTALQHSASVPVTGLGEAVRHARHGFSIRPPVGWHIRNAPDTVVISQTDYLLGGVRTPVIRVLVTDVASGVDGARAAKRMLAVLQKAATDKGLAAKVLSEGPAALGGLPGYQFAAWQEPARAAKAEGSAGADTVIDVRRVAVLPRGEALFAKCYCLQLTVRGGEAKAALALMDQLADGFAFLLPDTSPASGPASAVASRPAAWEK